MPSPKLPLLLGVLSVAAVAAQAQNAASTVSPSSTYTTVDAFGNLVRGTTSKVVPSAPSAAELAAAQSLLGANTVASSDRTRRGRDRGDQIRVGTSHYGPTVPYYPYPYPAPAVNNYYFPPQPTTTVIGSTNYRWEKPVTITSIPLGTSYYGGYPAPGYPAYPTPGYGYPVPGSGYPAPGYFCPAPGYGFPAPNYGHSAYPGVPYPAYGTTTYVYGSGNGSIYSQSQTGGYGVSVGNGGLSIQFGNRRSTSSTTVTRY